MTDRDRLAQIILKARINANPLSQVGYAEADALLANGVILPPCKVGDVIYHLYPIQGIVAKKVKRIQYGSYGLMIADGNGVFHSDVIGKTVFLTKEEAEKVLAERSKE